MTHLVLLTVFCLAQIAVGLAIGRRVRSTSDFFVAGRRLGPAMLFSTMIAANIGAGSTVGAAGYGYRDGLAAWWWVGSAALGSIVLGLWVGPAHPPARRGARPADPRRLSRVALRLARPRRHHLAAVAGHARDPGRPAPGAGVRAGGRRRLAALDRLPRRRRGDDDLLHLRRHAVDDLGEPGAAGGAARRLRRGDALTPSVRWAAGTGCARPPTAAAPTGARGAAADPAGSSWPCSARRSSCRRACCRRSTRARDDRAVRIGVLANAAVLFAFAFLPVLLGMIARALHPGLPDRELALPIAARARSARSSSAASAWRRWSPPRSAAPTRSCSCSRRRCRAISTSASCARRRPTPTCCASRASPRSSPASPASRSPSW